MKRFTKLFMTLALLCVAGSVSAQEDDEIALTADMFYNWNGYGADAASTSTATVDFNIGNDAEIGAGGMVCGTSTVDYLIYADLTGSTKLLIEGTAGSQLRVLMNRQESNSGPLVEKNPTIGDDGKAELDLTELSYVHINAIKFGWGSPAGKITSIKFVKPSDPLAIPKEALKKVIDKGKLQSSFAKTADSFAALTSAISAGESTLNDATTAEELEDAANVINEAIAGLTLEEGFVNLTKEMCHVWDGDGIDAQIESDNIGFEEHYGSVGQGTTVWGSGSVLYLQYADVSAYGKLYIVGTPGATFRALLNRKDSNDGPLLEFTVVTDENGVGEVDLQNGVDKDGKKIADDGFAHVNAIKTPWNGQTVTISEILLEELTEATTVPVTIGEAGYATFCSDKAVALESGMEAYAVEYNGSSAQLIPVEGAVDANTPVILKADADDYELEIVESAASPDKNDLKVSDGNVTGDGSIYVLANGEKGVGFYRLASGETVPAGKCYLQADGAREFIGFGDATGIKSVETVKANGAVYNLAGQQVKNAQKGVFIVNGKKVIK